MDIEIVILVYDHDNWWFNSLTDKYLYYKWIIICSNIMTWNDTTVIKTCYDNIIAWFM